MKLIEEIKAYSLATSLYTRETINNVREWIHRNTLTVVICGLLLIFLVIPFVFYATSPHEKHITLEPGYKYINSTFNQNTLYITLRRMHSGEIPERYIIKSIDSEVTYHIQEMR